MNFRVSGRGRESGQALVIFTFALAVLLGFVALTIDIGLFFVERRSLQNAADAAALAGARELPDDDNAAVAAAVAWAAQNGYTSADGAFLEVNTPHQGDPSSIEVVISVEQPFVFARVLGLDSADVKARAVAVAIQGVSTAGSDAALLVLDETSCRALDKSGTNTLTIKNSGSIVVNSNCSNTSNGALNKGGSGHLIADGGIYYYEDGTVTQSGSGTMVPEPEPMTSRISDPLLGMVPPSLYGSPDPTSPDSGGTAAAPQLKDVNSGNHTFRPGVYWGGISIKSTANVTFQPGVYIFAGGGLSLTGSGTITGTDVMFYNTKKDGGTCGLMNLRGSAKFSFSAPTSGPYKDILLWQDAACTTTITFEGSGGTSGGSSGVIYAPSATLGLSGSGNLGALQMIVNKVNITGSGDITIDFIPYIDIPTDGSAALKLVE